MLDEKSLLNAQKLINYINITSHKFEQVTQRIPYFHMGATITDAILQAGLSYKSVVYPRILNLLTKYSDYKTTCDFIILMQTIPLSNLINWENELKLSRITNLSYFFYENKIENENDLAKWLHHEKNINKLFKINGIGPKTIDYLKMLSGNQAISIDRHLFKYLELAGVVVKSYNEAHKIFSLAAEMLNVTQYELDRKIWTYMSENNVNKNNNYCCGC